ncbi:MAG: glycoside hydrolase family 2 TIM barrel-domain containing protein [Niabella sp.]
MKIKIILLVGVMSIASLVYAQPAIELKYLSGLGNEDGVLWDFYCTEGRNSGRWTKIKVPSNWELQGFGKYDYGHAKDSVRGKEQGLYKYRFTVPKDWRNKKVNIVFEGVMTDAEVKINGTSAGPVHQGAFYIFRYDISALLRYGSINTLEVTVSKESTNPSVNLAERHADYWIFGGIYRPVYLEALPQQNHISAVALNGMASGKLVSKVTIAGKANRLTVQVLDDKNNPVSESEHQVDIKDGIAEITTQTQTPRLWTSETPHLYTAVYTIYHGNKAAHQVKQKFGFRTIEVREKDGIYINGVKIKLKGIGRHSFYPSSGRTTSKKLSIKDVLLIKEMNMNAVRMSHYPPDQHFLDACDSLGLYVIDELAGWQKKYDTEIGAKLVKEMLEADANHPSIILWANGNEGGHNFELVPLYKKYDLQNRAVIHPWYLFGGIETQHYREYNYGINSYNQGTDILLPTEFLHSMYDGGGGAGLDDYWKAMWSNSLAAGGFLWAYADEGIVRTDKNGWIDTDGDRAPDGVVGPYREKEGSFFAIKEIWSPVVIEKKNITPSFNGILQIENRYHFTNTKDCSFSWKLKKIDTPGDSASGTITAPDILPLNKGALQLNLPANWQQYDALYVAINDPSGRELFTWSFPVTAPATMAAKKLDAGSNNERPKISKADSVYLISVKNTEFVISEKGILKKVRTPKGELPFNNGPWLQGADNNNAPVEYYYKGDTLVLTQSVKDKGNKITWQVYPNGWLQLTVAYFPNSFYGDYAGVSFSLPENTVQSVQYLGNGPYRVWRNRMKGTQFGIWNKKYNGTETGEAWEYPEFKGYYSNIYWCNFSMNGQSFRVMTSDDNVFLRLYTPHSYTGYYKDNYKMIFPSGDVSFLNAIPAIGNKFNKAEDTGPQGMKYIYNNTENIEARKISMNLYFSFLQ